MKNENEVQEIVSEFEEKEQQVLETFEVSNSSLGELTVFRADGKVKSVETTVEIAMTMDSSTMAKLLLASQRGGFELINKR